MEKWNHSQLVETKLLNQTVNELLYLFGKITLPSISYAAKMFRVKILTVKISMAYTLIAEIPDRS